MPWIFALLRLPKEWMLAFSELLLCMKRLAFAMPLGIIESVGDIQYRPRAQAAGFLF